MSLCLLLLLLVTCDAQSLAFTNPFLGTVMTYYPGAAAANRSVTVNLRYKLNFELCTELQWQCLTGDCGTESIEVNPVVINAADLWCQTEGISTRQVPTNAPFQLWLNGGDWTSNENNIVGSKAVTLVDLRTRSDTGKANTSPQTTILPNLREPSNCRRLYSLLAFDPDGDAVRCRPGNASLSECDTCTLPPGFILDTSCSFSLRYSKVLEGSQSYALQFVMEDFPRQTITLNGTSGAQTTLTASDAISKIPVQFVFQVDAAAPSCVEGLYLPQFLPPTPSHGARLFTAVDQMLQVDVTAQANVSTISDLVVSGPYNVIQTSSGPGQFGLTWTPSQSEAGQSLPICFVVEASFNSARYQSALRCVTVTVVHATLFADPTGNAAPSTPSSPVMPANNTEPSNVTDPTTPSASSTNTSTTLMTPSATYIVGLSVKMSSPTPLSDAGISSAIQQVKNRLVSLGLLRDITVRIVSAVQH